MVETYSQAHQDLFVLWMTKSKKSGSFLEIGANHPSQGGNNTYLLEKNYDWNGLMIEYDKQFAPLYEQIRPRSKYIIGDARNIDYVEALKPFPSVLHYLQIDLDVNNRSSLDVLERLDQTVFDSYTFATVTFEHDIYTGDYFSTRSKSREIFAKRGYILIFPDVCVYLNGNWVPFEDWYVYPDSVRSDFSTMKTDQSMKSVDISNKFI